MEFKVNVLHFIPNREKYSTEFMLPTHKQFRDWYFNKFSSKKLKIFKEKYYEYLEKIGYKISFVKWIKSYYDKNNNIKICVSKENRVWEMSNGKNITCKHPPVGDLIYRNIEATAFVKVDEKKLTIEDLSTIMKQNNYTHLHLQTITFHLFQIEEKNFPRNKRKEKMDDITLK